MIDGVQIKVCGIRSLVDADFADRCGADYLGFIFYPASPRYVPPAQFSAMASRLPDRRRVAVSVEPTPEELRAQHDAGFERFQIHFQADTPIERVKEWSTTVGPDRLWLAPRIAPGQEFPDGLMPLARTFLLDAYHPDRPGGTGRTGDWELYRRLRAAHPDRTWILSGGLNAENIGPALTATDSRFVDVNSGVESAPGVKDEARLEAFIVAVHRSREARLRAPAGGA